MRKVHMMAVGAVLLLGRAAVADTTLVVDAADNIFGAGQATAPGGGNLPQEYDLGFAAPAGTVLTFSSVTGTVSLNGGGNSNDPDGIGSASNMANNPSGSLSGISNDHAGFLVGVFLGPGAPSGSPPASLAFTDAGGAGTIATSFASLAPLLNQTFFIGDGLTGDGAGTVQMFDVPVGATRLFLGFADAGGYHGDPGAYGDNSGTFTAIFSVSAAVPEPASVLLLGAGALGLIGRRAARGRGAGPSA